MATKLINREVARAVFTMNLLAGNNTMATSQPRPQPKVGTLLSIAQHGV